MRKTYGTIVGLLPVRQKRRFLLLIALMLAMALSDLAGVASIMPFLAVLANPGVVEDSAWLGSVYALLGFESTRGFLQFLGVAVFGMVMLSIAVRAATFYAVTRFSRALGMSLAIALLRRYLARPYEWFLNQHSADLGKSILQEVNQVVTGSIAPAIRLIANGIVALFLVGFLLVIEPVGALAVALLLGLAFGLIYGRLRTRLVEFGQDRRGALRERHQITAEAMNGIKEVKVLGLEAAYLERFVGPSRRLARHQAAVALIGEMPRFVLEALAFGGMLLFVLYLLWAREGGLDAVLPVLGAFAFSGLKLLPTMQTLFADLSQLRFHEPVLQGLSRDLAGPAPALPAQPRERLALSREIALEDVRYTYPGAGKPALDGLSLTIPAGRMVGFVGPTGAGKTTVVDVILGLLQPQSGRLRVDDTAVGPENLRAWQRGIGYVPQSIYLVDDTVAANIAFGETAAALDRAAVERAARMANIDDVVRGLPQGYDTMIGEAGVRLSGGQRQRLGIARALYRDPDVIVFDEATSALDNVTERAVVEAIRGLHGQKTILVIAHRLTTIVDCDRIYLLEDGRLAGAGDYRSLVEGNDTFRSLATAAE